MKLIQGRQKAFKFAPQDFISNMPDIVVTNILDRLPLHEAVRTCILARDWRYKWTTLSQLIFDIEFIEYLEETKQEKDYERIVSRLLLNLIGSITKFVLYIHMDTFEEDIAQWILFLSRKGVKDLTIVNWDYEEVRDLPSRLFSCLEVEHLDLDNTRVSPPASFHGFPNLLSLDLYQVEFASGRFGELFTQYPVLEILNLRKTYYSNVKLVEIAKLTNLRKLSLFLYALENIMVTSFSSIFELVGSLPKLKELELNFLWINSPTIFTEDGATERSPTTFPSLKTLKLLKIDLGQSNLLSSAFQIIRSSPNLHTLKVTADDWEVAPLPAACSFDIDYDTTWLLQLQNVVFEDLKGSENEVCLIKYLLAYSPFLKKIVIHPHRYLSSKEKLMYSTKLLELHRASPVAEIKLCSNS